MYPRSVSSIKSLLLILFILQCSPLTSSFLLQDDRKQITTFLRETPENQQSSTTYETAEEKFNARWNVMFERLKKYKEEYGDCLVPKDYEDDPTLGTWVQWQRRAASLDEKARTDRRDKLNSIGFVWSVQKRSRSPKLDKMWNEKFERLKEYKREHGNCLVPYKWPHDPPLGRWVQRQRSLFANNKLHPDRRAYLESIGFVWKAGDSLTEIEKQWEVMFTKLEEYRDENGDCLVPRRYDEDPPLGKWVADQRNMYKRSELDLTRQKRLESIGFIWDHLDLQWENMFAKLEEYKDKHGDCLVPRFFEGDLQLGRWVWTQRENRSKLDRSRRQKLESLGFVWDLRGQRWETMFGKLEEFRDKHGDCLVPEQCEEDPQLGQWVRTQRKNRTKLDPFRFQRLESLGFVWDLRDQR